jgi:hypothetical protein
MKDWLADASIGKIERLAYICKLLGLTQPLPDGLRYQLLHRSASAVIEANRFKTDEAATIVHSFSQSSDWFSDFRRFAELFGLTPSPGRLLTFALPSGMPMHLAWVKGDALFLSR